MKIVMLAPDSFMIDRRILLEAKTLVQAGHNVTLLSGFECSEEHGYTQDGIQIYRYTGRWRSDLLGKVRRYFPFSDGCCAFIVRLYMFLANRFFDFTPFDHFVMQKALEFDADVYHVHDFPCLKGGVLAARAKGVPLVYDAHELFYAQAVLPVLLRKAFFRLEKKYIQFPDVVLSVNPFIAKLMAERYGIRKPHVIMNCTTPPSDFKPEEAGRLLREKGGIPEDFRIVLYQGWLSSERNIETLVRAVKWFPDDSCLVVIGYGVFEQILRKAAKDEGVERKVYFLGQLPCDEILRYTAGADIGVIPYMPIDDNHRYCSPNKFFEFITAGVPVIAHDLPFLRWMSEQYGVVHLTDLGSPQVFGDTVRQVLSDAARLERMKERCREAARELNWETEGNKLLKLYPRIAKDK